MKDNEFLIDVTTAIDKYINKSRLKKYKFFYFSALVLLIFILAGLVSLTLIKKFLNLNFLFNGLYEDRLKFYLVCLFSVIIIFLVLSITKKLIIKIFLLILSLAFIFPVIFSYAWNDLNPEYYYFNSPDSTRTLIFEETSIFSASNCYAYTKINSLFISPLNFGTSLTEDYGYMQRGSYELTWLDNETVSFKFTYTYGEGYKKTVSEIINLK